MIPCLRQSMRFLVTRSDDNHGSILTHSLALISSSPQYIDYGWSESSYCQSSVATNSFRDKAVFDLHIACSVDSGRSRIQV